MQADNPHCEKFCKATHMGEIYRFTYAWHSICGDNAKMTPVHAPASISSQIEQEIHQLQDASTKYLKKDFTWRLLEKRVNDVRKVDLATGNYLTALLYQVMGDVDQVEYWLKQFPIAGGNSYELAGMSFCMRSNLGFFSRAAETFAHMTDIESGELSRYYAHGLGTACFREVLNNIAIAERAKLELPNVSVTLQIAQECHFIAERLGLHQAEMQRCLDVAGEVMRENQLFWMDGAPYIHRWNDADGSSLLYEFSVGTTPAVAADLTMEIIERTVDRDIALNGFSVCLKGIIAADQ